ncbi:MAG: NUDIX domain-containing protein [Spirochaetales bacterium]|nr:NUDIX domain-containing protein [Spirochaetales bacterium]
MQRCARCGADVRVEHGRACRCNVCDFILFFNVGAATAAIVEDESARLLFTIRAKEPAAGYLDLPGGFIEPDETAEEAIAREIKEELNVSVENLRFFCTVPNRYLFCGVIYHTLDVIFLGFLAREADLQPADDVTGFEWLKKEEIDLDRVGLDAARLALRKYLDTA